MASSGLCARPGMHEPNKKILKSVHCSIAPRTPTAARHSHACKGSCATAITLSDVLHLRRWIAQQGLDFPDLLLIELEFASTYLATGSSEIGV